MGIWCTGFFYPFPCRFDMDVLDKKGLGGVIIDQNYSVKYFPIMYLFIKKAYTPLRFGFYLAVYFQNSRPRF